MVWVRIAKRCQARGTAISNTHIHLQALCLQEKSLWMDGSCLWGDVSAFATVSSKGVPLSLNRLWFTSPKVTVTFHVHLCSFIEMWFIYYKVHSFKRCHSMLLSILKGLCNLYHHLIGPHFHYPWKELLDLLAVPNCCTLRLSLASPCMLLKEPPAQEKSKGEREMCLRRKLMCRVFNDFGSKVSPLSTNRLRSGKSSALMKPQ